MDEETKRLAMLALRNSFWMDFSGLVNDYLAAAEGIDIKEQEMLMGELTSIYGRDAKATTDTNLSIWTQNKGSRFNTTGHDTLINALEFEPATEVHMRGKKIFEKRNGEWHFLE